MAAFARATDPITSHWAAESITNSTQVQKVILQLLVNPMTDFELVLAFNNLWRNSDLPVGLRASESGIRTRRAELVRAGLVEDSGNKVTLGSGRKAIIWSLVPDKNEGRLF
jgi:hypothetical protein